MSKTTIRLFIMMGLSLMLAVSGCTDFQEGEDAYNRGNYETALKKFRPLGERGDPAAQFLLGEMYGHGKGVPQDYSVAMKWYRLAANQGLADAQYTLGLWYVLGEKGGPQDYVLAHMWLTLAAHEGEQGAFKPKDILENKMTPDQLAEAQRLAREWKPKGRK